MRLPKLLQQPRSYQGQTLFLSVFEQWSKAIEYRDADALIDLLHEDFEFVRHQSGTSMNKAEISDMLRNMVANELVASREI